MLEVLIAVVILGLAYVTILQSFSLSMRNIHRIEQELTIDSSESSRLFLEARYEGSAGNPDVTADERSDGRDYLEGHQYRLVEISSEDGELITLRLDRL